MGELLGGSLCAPPSTDRDRVRACLLVAVQQFPYRRPLVRYVVVEGEVEVRLPNGAVRQLAPDETFGEMAIIDSSPRSGMAVAVADTKLAVIDRPKFLFLVQETPMFAPHVMSSMAERIRAADTS